MLKQRTPDLPSPQHQKELKLNVGNENQIPESEKEKPDLDVGTPETRTKITPKPKTKVVQPNDIKLFLAIKKRERELKLISLRGSDTNIVETLKNTPSKPQCSSTLRCTNQISPNPLPPSAQGTRNTSIDALSTA